MKSKLATYTRLTKNHSGKRTSPVKHIVIHHMAGVMTGKQCADYFATTSRQVSSNYTIGYNGDIACSVLEEHRAWTTASNRVDQKSITIEVSNSSYGGQWPVSNASMNALIRLIADICKRHGIKECTYTGNEKGTLLMHKWYANTNCPGPYLGARFSYIASEVNKLLERDMNKATSATSTKGVYVVKHGDSLWSIAEAQLGDGKRWSEIKTLNKLNSNVIYTDQTLKLPESKPKLLSLQEIAKEVIAGEWGNGADRKNRLTQAGYDYNAVQAEVNRQLTIPVSKPLVVGSKVKIKKTATNYATGQKIPSWVKNITDTVIQIKTDRVLLKGIYSWVYKKDIEVL